MENRTDLIYVIDPETGIVRDINTLGNFCGAYCFYNLQTNLAETLGTSLINSESTTFLNNVKSTTKKADEQARVTRYWLKETFLNKVPGPGDLPKWTGIIMTFMTFSGLLAQPAYDAKEELSKYIITLKNNTTNNTTELIISYNNG